MIPPVRMLLAHGRYIFGHNRTTLRISGILLQHPKSAMPLERVRLLMSRHVADVFPDR